MNFQTFRNNLRLVGIHYDGPDLRYLWKVAKQSSKTTGAITAASRGVAMSSVGKVPLPFIGSIPGWVAGTLAGWVGGTAACTIARTSVKKELDKIISRKP